MTILRVSELIECKHMTSILACLYMRGSMGKSEIYDTISNSPNMALKLRILSDEGLVESNQVGRRTEYSLTEKGSSVAEKLCGLEELVYGVNVFPSQIESVIGELPFLSPFYHITLENANYMDALPSNLSRVPGSSSLTSALMLRTLFRRAERVLDISASLFMSSVRYSSLSSTLTVMASM